MECLVSFSSGPPTSRLHPFGSFRHEGSFPASLISGSVTSRHLCDPPTSEYSEEESNDTQNSTHIYINLLDISDQGATKSTKFWSDDASNPDDTSEFSSIHSDDAPLEICVDYRGTCTTEIEEYGLAYTPRNITRQPIQVSLSSHRNLNKPPMAPRPAKTAVQSKVGPWLQQVTTPSRPRVPTHNTTVSSTITDAPSDSATETSAQIPGQSDMSSFMNLPLFTCGISKRKVISGSRSKFLKRLHKLFKKSRK